jgi:site-specific DNA-methyltransferase (adenine-specific)
MIEITNEDNMELMKRYPDNYFDLAIVDPPYGLGDKTTKGGCNKNTQVKFKEHNWDDAIPTDDYFEELFRVSKRQIIWGGNYFPYIWKNGCRGLITWDKMVYIPTMSQVEYAWYSEDKLPKLVKINNNDSNRLHPTQKPVKLYEWVLSNYAEPNQKILDTHIGSGSIAIAVDNANKIDKMNLTLVGCELDKDYYNATMKRIKEQTSWQSLF